MKLDSPGTESVTDHPGGQTSQATRINRSPLPSAIRTGNPGLVHWVGGLALPTVGPLVLLVCLLAWGKPLTPGDLVLGTLVFFIQYPGRWSTTKAGIDVGNQVLTPWATVMAVLGAIALIGHESLNFDLPMLASWLIATPIAQIVLLRLLPTVMAKLVAMRREMHRIVVVGAGNSGQSFARAVNNDAIAHTKVVAFFDDRNPMRLGSPTDAPLAGKVKDIGKFARDNKVDQIYIALPMSSQPRITGLLHELQDCTASVYFVPDILTMDLIQPRVDTHAGFPVVGVCDSPFTGVNAITKRAMDLLLSSTAVVMLFPVMIAIALLIKLTSPGPVLFKQRRFGLDSTEITVWKFRSMSVTEDGSKQYTQVVRGDPRVTPLGVFLRKTSLDELPQFINVLQGRMSIVGPRPHALKVNDQYRRLIPGYMVRHKVRPGITGWAQVNGYRGGDDLASMTKRIEHDLAYLRHWSIWLDLRILCRTVGLVAKDTTAY